MHRADGIRRPQKEYNSRKGFQEELLGHKESTKQRRLDQCEDANSPSRNGEANLSVLDLDAGYNSNNNSEQDGRSDCPSN